ncbi:MAG: NB-ARC domain-containing protein, partial [Nitrososphaera sp.]|nr:NB-ARC domain-containing protein [Nitrososphaera sp.]
MAQEQRTGTFGEMLRYFRGQTVDRGTGKPLSQDRFAYQLSEKTGLNITRNRESNWENGKSSPHPHLDRDLLTAIVAVLHKFRGIKSLDEANLLLEAGRYQRLVIEEIAQVDKAWIQSGSSEQTKEEPNEKSLPPQVNIPGFSGTLPITLNIEARKPLPLSLLTSKFGPGSAPPLPSLIVGRDEDLNNLKENLGITGKAKTSIQVLTAIKGWPGVGKTTIASALAQDKDVQKAFPDGVLWVSLGQEPNLPSEIAA